MPEAVLSALLGLFGLYVAGVTFSLQQLSDRYSPRLLPRLRRRHVSPHLGVLAALVAVAGGLVAGKNHEWATPVALLLLLGSVVYALKLLPQGWGLASLDLQQGWLNQDDLTPDIVQDMLSRLTLRRDGVALVTVLSGVSGRDELEAALTTWFEDRPDLLTERWCGPVVVQAWTHGLAEHNAQRRRGALIETVSRRLQLPGAPGVGDLVLQIMSAVKQSDTWGEDLKQVVVDLGLILTYEPGEPATRTLRALTGEVQLAQEWFEIKVEHIRHTAVDVSTEQAAWFADLLGTLLRKLPEEWLIVETRKFAERPEMNGKWTDVMGLELLNGLDWASRSIRRHPERYPTEGLPDSESLLAEPTLAILRAMRYVPMDDNYRRYLAQKVQLGPEFQRRKEEAIGVTAAVPDEQLQELLPEPTVTRGGDWLQAVCRGLKRRGNR